MIYLDYAATYPIPKDISRKIRRAERMFFANASALHTPGHLAMNEIEKCRSLLASIVGAEKEEIIFVSGASEANNTVIRTFDGHIIETSPLEHHSILESARLFGGQKKPILFSYMLANNETGDLLDLSEITEKASRCSAPKTSELFNEKDDFGRLMVTEKKGGYVHSDLTQALGKIPLNVHKLKLDYATFSAHKIGGPTGIGALYVKKGVPFKPLIMGGNQENKRRGGTYNTMGIIGFRLALERMLNKKSIEDYDTRIRSYRDELARWIIKNVPGSSLNTSLKKGKSLPNILNVSFRAAEGESIQLYLDAEGIIVSTGSACAAGDIKPSHVLMAKTGDAEVAHSSIRFSFGLENTKKDIESVKRKLPKIIKRLQDISTI